MKPAGRGAVLALSGGLCHYCADEVAVTLDHIVPRSSGGPSCRWNLIGACKDCNGIKGSLRGVCPCFRCIEAERLFAGYSKPSNVKVRRPRTKPIKPAIAPIQISDGPCPITLSGQHVVASKGITNYCARCSEILAA